jgi:hypothetical protein
LFVTAAVRLAPAKKAEDPKIWGSAVLELAALREMERLRTKVKSWLYNLYNFNSFYIAYVIYNY